MKRRGYIMTGISTAFLWAGCQGPPAKPPLSGPATRPDDTRAMFGDFELPRAVGTVENIGLQLPAVSPDGTRLLYLRTDQDALSPMTLFGSPDPQHTPGEGTLSVWVRPLAGAAVGNRLSRPRWSHSPAWSETGQAVVYVVNEPPGSMIIWQNLQSGEERVLGVTGQLNCLPRFDGDDQAILFCSSRQPGGPFRIYRQTANQAEPTPLSPEGMDCALPVATIPDVLLCARIEGQHFNWIICGPRHTTDLVTNGGPSDPSALLQTWAGIGSPLSPDRKSLLFYDGLQNRIAVLNHTERLVRRHRLTSMAACWLSNSAMAMATPEGLFAVDAMSGVSVSLLTGAWIPARYVPQTQTLVLLGKSSNPRRLSIMELQFKPAGRTTGR